MTENQTALPIDGQRVDEWIATFAALTDESVVTPGVTRLAYTPLEREAHALFTDFMANLGLKVWTDAVGNTIAEIPGTEDDHPAVGTGSHLDSVPSAGRFDGVVGVVAAMLSAEAIVRSGITHRHPIRFVVFACEEGARFGQACIGSRIVAGLTTSADLERLKDSDGVSVAEAMSALGFDSRAVEETLWSPEDWAGFIELHIEQGSVLESEGIPIGIVDVISGSSRFEVELTGIAAHSGGMPMHLRRDALAAAAEILVEFEKLANDELHDGTRITVGRLDVQPGSITTIPGRCVFSVDVRDTDEERQQQTVRDAIEIATAIANKRSVAIATRKLADAAPRELSSEVRQVLAETCQDQSVQSRSLPSGGSHDAQMVSTICPTGMLFIPSGNGGVSHTPDEFSSTEDIVRGAEILVDAVQRLAGTQR
ncbi:Zn-dependent hydrolase [Corynebacterium sputi]|uniref:Zn-dependent hydrolase n=1 Tax=Corynebacterium sputi TaxID=489915 RepID=UPI00042835FF|nr:Zn-dependent hydrolase [Corynebacterium sputi]